LGLVGEWRPSTWGDEVTLEYGKAIRGYSPVQGNYRVFGSNGPIGWTSEALAQGPGVILGRKGAYRGVEYSREPFWVIDTAYYLVPKTELDMRWLYYAVKHYKLGEVDDGSPIPSTTRAAVYMLELDVPTKAEQRAIAHILGMLDDNIECNRRRNQTLESMARALFQDWFIDFGPVRARMEGQEPYLPADLWQLFPDRLDDEGKPEGWSNGSFGNIISQRSERVGARDVVVLSAVASGKLARSDDHFTKRVYSKETNKYLLIEQWDFAYNPSRINIGSIGILEDAILGGVSPVYVVVRPKPAYRWFLAFSIRSRHTMTWINTLASGSVRQSLSYTDFASIPCVVPPEVIVQEFNQQWSTFREGIRSLDTESRTLAQLRDTLLPKLISGELRVPDAERIIGATV
jgi:type I restriction enzyme S subunit